MLNDLVMNDIACIPDVFSGEEIASAAFTCYLGFGKHRNPGYSSRAQSIREPLALLERKRLSRQAMNKTLELTFGQTFFFSTFL